MSPTLLAHLRELENNTRRDHYKDARLTPGAFRYCQWPRDYFRPLALTELYSWCRP